MRQGGNWEQLMANIQTLKRLRDQYKLQTYFYYNFVITRINVHELSSFIERAVTEWGADNIQLGHVQAAPKLTVLDEPAYRAVCATELANVESVRRRYPFFSINTVEV